MDRQPFRRFNSTAIQLKQGRTMNSMTMRKRDGTETTVDGGGISSLSAGLAGKLITPQDPDYDEARSLWNAMIDKRPGLVARVQDSSDVAQVVRFAREHDLLLAIKGAGHNIAGRGVCDGGIVIDFAEMKAVNVDPGSQKAIVEAGCTLGDLDAATQPHGLAIPAGINSTTGIAGLTLGGGFGWLSRKHGLTVDNLLSAQVVTADGDRESGPVLGDPGWGWELRGRYLVRVHAPTHRAGGVLGAGHSPLRPGGAPSQGVPKGGGRRTR
jgi:FAD/FMN-containing dehydrogenase